MTTEVLTQRNLGGLRIEKVEDTPMFLNFLIYGEPGAGKTRLAGSADAVPEMRKVIIVDMEGGTFTLKSCYPDVERVRVTTWKEMQEVYDELYVMNHGYKTVIIDSLTEVQKFNMYSVLNSPDRKEGLDEDIAGLHDWGKNIEQMRKYVRAFRDLPMNTIFTCLAKSDKNTKTGAITKKPYMSGKLADEVAGFLDEVFYLYTKNIEGENTRLLLTDMTDEYVAKDRSSKLDMIVQNPTMSDLYHTITTKG